MKKGISRVLPRPAMVVAVIALVAALAGSATAASGFINGKKIKRGTVTGKQIKNRSIGLVELKKAAINQLKGQRGPQGPKGDAGPQGPQGPAGVVQPIVASQPTFDLPDGQEKEVTSITAPESGSYLLQAKLIGFAASADGRLDCALQVAGNDADRAMWGASENSDYATLNMVAQAELQQGQKASILCLMNNSGGSASQVKLVAIPVAS